ncbi:peptidase dimerization domain-containing protein [Brevibacillus sp. SIMBA_040]|uniref:peptidase dimerization domain-containing protein n=1 Tax=Brevibacillus sp. SIMBA_040 TaxID=3085781 RepID=UPI00397CCDA1
MMVAHKGALWLDVTMFGKTAHGSMPHHGINAIHVIHRSLTELNHFQLEHVPHAILRLYHEHRHDWWQSESQISSRINAVSL